MEFVWVSSHTWRYSVSLRILSTPRMSDCSVITLGRAEVAELESYLLPSFLLWADWKPCSGALAQSPVKTAFQSAIWQLLKMSHLLLRCTAKHLSHTCCGISTSSVAKPHWPSLHSWASPLALPVSWCQYDIMNLKSLMCSRRHKATLLWLSISNSIPNSAYRVQKIKRYHLVYTAFTSSLLMHVNRILSRAMAVHRWQVQIS